MTTIHQIYAVFYASDGDTNQPGTFLALVSPLQICAAVIDVI